MTKEKAREQLADWKTQLKINCYESNPDLQHSLRYHFPDNDNLQHTLHAFGQKVSSELEPIVQRNDERFNLPRMEHYNGIGERTDQVIHTPWYDQAGDIIYGSDLMNLGATPGKLTQALLLFFLSSHAGEAGHNCPIACSAGLIRVLQRCKNIPNQENYLERLTAPSFKNNFTAAQFLTELQGGSDVGANQVYAEPNANGFYQINGEKWFCSNANADLILISARYNNTPGTRGIGLFLIPTILPNGEPNRFNIRRLKEKIGTRALASAEIDFHNTLAYPILPLENSFKILMQDVLHISRLYNTFCVLGMGRRAYQIASNYAKYRHAFGSPIIDYPLVKNNLTQIHVENTALMAAATATATLQDQFDLASTTTTDDSLLLRLLANLNKSISALWSFNHIHHCIDVLAGNGAIESFSSLPRLLRDSLVCENWEGTHNTLYMQILRDIDRYQIDTIFTQHILEIITKLPVSDERKLLESQLKQLTYNINTIKNDSSEFKTLHLPKLTEDMMTLYASTHLLKEALHQQTSTNENSKYNQWSYFQRQHHITAVKEQQRILLPL
jgi:acyl-CoA dehydrogenase